jgi:hypothetical protein
LENVVRRFPRREAEVAALARQIVSGMRANADDFPSPPLQAAELKTLLDVYKRTHEAALMARAAATVAFDAKDKALENLVDGMKATLGYAERAVKYDEAKLKSLGWRKRREPTPPTVPGQARKLEVVREGPGWVDLKWKRPEDGGSVATYQLQVRHHSRGEWRNAAMCFETKTVLTDQERGVDLTYRVVTLNKAGEGLASNTVTVVL